ncbi:MAG: erythromycin esterase family protein [Planctomycetota bacterium]
MTTPRRASPGSNPRGRAPRIPFGALAALLWSTGCSTLPPDPSVSEWIEAAAVPLSGNLGALDPLVADALIVGLGEATHGQRESFQAKHRLTMHLVIEHGFRVVAYEASLSTATACDDYIAGRSDDREAAIAGLSMLIWSIEENAALLDDLRAWNRAAAPADRVRFLGCDAQSIDAPKRRLRDLLGEAGAHHFAKFEDLSARAAEATSKLFSGDRTQFDSMREDVLAWETAVLSEAPASDAERFLVVRECRHHLTMYGSPGGRDFAMAELLRLQLEQLSPQARCVLWAHNAHVQKGALRYQGSQELAQGGHLAAAFGDGYVAIGFAFGEGEFQANAQGPDGRWGFRRYRLSRAVEGSLDAQLLAAKSGDYILDLRHAPNGAQVQRWLATGHGHRWFGGYNIPEDYDARSQDLTHLLPTHPRADFDGLIFLARTTAATPIDPARVLH